MRVEVEDGRAVALVMVVGFSALILISVKAYDNAPPIPAKSVTPAGEIVYTAAELRVFAVPLAPRGDDLAPGLPDLLFTAPRALAVFAPTADHTRFLTAAMPADRTEPPLRLVLDWRPSWRAAGTGR